MITDMNKPPRIRAKGIRLVIAVGWEQGQASMTLGEPKAILETIIPNGASQAKIVMVAKKGIKNAMQHLRQREESLPIRVLALSHTDSERNAVVSFGEGWYIGDTIPDPSVGGAAAVMHERKVLTPCILLDGGATIYGCECHWGPAETTRKRYPEDKWKWETKSVVDHRREVAAATTAQDPPFKVGDKVLLRAEVEDVPARSKGEVLEVVAHEEALVVGFQLEEGGEVIRKNLRPENIEHDFPTDTQPA